jgi:hypothetical protein
MSKTIEFGAFVQDASARRLSQAQQVADDLGVTLHADGSRFAGSGAAGDPIKVTVTVPDGTALSAANIRQGRDALDDLLSNGERLTDYALVKQDGALVQVVSLLTAGVQDVPVRPVAAPAAVPAPAPRRRWSPFAGR